MPLNYDKVAQWLIYIQTLENILNLIRLPDSGAWAAGSNFPLRSRKWLCAWPTLHWQVGMPLQCYSQLCWEPGNVPFHISSPYQACKLGPREGHKNGTYGKDFNFHKSHAIVPFALKSASPSPREIELRRFSWTGCNAGKKTGTVSALCLLRYTIYCSDELRLLSWCCFVDLHADW